MNLKFLEDNGTIKLQSTPKLSTKRSRSNLKSGEKHTIRQQLFWYQTHSIQILRMEGRYS